MNWLEPGACETSAPERRTPVRRGPNDGGDHANRHPERAEPEFGAPSAAALARMLSCCGEPLFLANWERVLMLHFEVDGDELQRAVPYELDLHEGRAFVSLVAFTMRGMRPRFGGRLAAWSFKPIATHEFLNVRTYVRPGGQAGIHFMAEWLSNRLAVRLGPPTFGLPYRHGRIDYQHQWERGRLYGSVDDTATGARLRYHAELSNLPRFAPCESGSFDEWLMERYTAFNSVGRRARYFRVWHPPWPQTRVNAGIIEKTLLDRYWPIFAGARLAGANFSPGVLGVWMGRPHRRFGFPLPNHLPIATVGTWHAWASLK